MRYPDLKQRSSTGVKRNDMLKLYDTTLRDGGQREGVSLTVDDKLRITARLDALGIDFIEGGFPGSNATDRLYFEQLQTLSLKHAEVTAFGMTTRKGVKPENDEGMKALAECAAQTITLVGKACEVHARKVLEASAQENHWMISESIKFLRKKKKRVFFDAEHYFDSFLINQNYALATLDTAYRAGAEVLILCDTNGGSLPGDVFEITRTTINTLQSMGIDAVVGIHAHNDTGCAIANSLEAVRAGATHIQGTVNGYGERVGNADILTLMANIQLKIGIKIVLDEQLAQLTSVSRFVSETFNIHHDAYLPYVGQNAFSHKGGLHAGAAMRYKHAYEHIDPAVVGNFSHIVVSELAGKSSLITKANELGIKLPKEDTEVRELLNTIKMRESLGYSYEVADASLSLLLRAETGSNVECFTLESFRVIAEKREDGRVISEATIKLLVGDERHVATGEGNGPVNALDAALRLAIHKFYPQVEKLELTDYKVRVLDASTGTAAVTRVLIETSDGSSTWGTIGVSDNVIEASWNALVDAITYGLMIVGKNQHA